MTHVGAWQWCFWIPALFALAGAVGLAVFLRDTPRSVGLPELEGKHTKVEDNTDSAEYKAFLREKVFRNPLIWTLAVANFFVYIVSVNFKFYIFVYHIVSFSSSIPPDFFV